MEKPISIVKQVRETILKDIADLSIEQLNIIPEGFRNNIVWNIGHLVAAQQSICYRRANLPMLIDDEYWETYRPGSKPERFLGEEDFEKVKCLLFSTMDKLTEDYANHIWTEYPAWTTRYGVDVTNINDAIIFLPFHEGLHAGTINAIKKLILK